MISRILIRGFHYGSGVSAESLGMMPMVKRRSWPAIVGDILEATLTPLSKTRIMYKANLNFVRFHQYFDDLLEKGFIEAVNGPDGRVFYGATDRGRTLLQVLRTAQDLVFSKQPSNNPIGGDDLYG